MSAIEPQTESSGVVMRFHAPDESATCRLAAQVAQACVSGDCILLKGDLGAGKTVFARAFIRSLLPGADVVSPTFNLVQTYPAGPADIWHFDLYRLRSAAELPEIGLDEALIAGITLIEWPEIAHDWLPETSLTVQLEPDGTGRFITLSGTADRWARLPDIVKERP